MVARLERQDRKATTPEASPLPAPEEHPEDFLTQKVRSMDRRPERIRGGKGYIHGSALIGICPRRYALQILSGETGLKPVREQDRIVWAIGRAVEDHIRTQFARAVKRRGVIGKWRCACGATKREGPYSPAEKCGTCGRGLNVYREITLFDHDYRIAGNPDILYLRPDNHKVRTVEIKSIKRENFDKLEVPQATHVVQASVYRRLGLINEMPMDDQVSIVYGSKDYSFRGSAYKEFHVDPTPDDQLDLMWQSAMEVKDYLNLYDPESGTRPTLPPRLAACTSVKSPMAKQCEQCGSCFAR